MQGWVFPHRRARDLTVVVCTYQRPGNLRRVLLSLAMQRDLREGFELVVTDDGSQDETEDVVAEFARTVDFPVAWTSHAHDGFQASRTRNDGVRLARGSYLLFLDGDCLVPHDHLARHLDFRRPGGVAAGDCCHLDEVQSQRVTEDVVRSGEYHRWALTSERKRLRRQHRKHWFYNAIRHATKPPLKGGDVGIWHADYVRVNGYDENYRGWGCEDDDLGRRLRWAGCRILSILGLTCTYHLWHPADPSVPRRWGEGGNVKYFLSRPRVPACDNGLMKFLPTEAA